MYKSEERQQKIMKMVELRSQGKSIQEIADCFGVSKQRVSQIFQNIQSERRYSKKSTYKTMEEKCIYPHITEWLKTNGIKMYQLSEIVGVTTKSTTTIRMKLNGERDFSITEIKRLLDYTNLTFEFLFYTKEGETNEEIL